MAKLIKNNAMCTIAFIIALITAFIVPPDKAYLAYFDLKTLCCLFMMLAVVCALRHVNFFYILACRIVRRFKNTRRCILALVIITFLGSMLITNDTALLTFLPLGWLVLSTTDKTRYLPFTFIMQNMAANLGGMLTPFGNPQNLFLYTKFNIPPVQFVHIMLPPFAVSMLLITLCCLFVKREDMEVRAGEEKLDKKRCALYLALFALGVAVMLRRVPYTAGFAIITAVLLVFDRRAIAEVDYGLLLTFVFFFIFSGNMARIEPVREFLSLLMDKNTLLYSALSCQVISNVPSAILLSQFTANYPALLVGINIGGAGTLIASLASLITFHEFRRHEPEKTGRFVAEFSAFNFPFLALLILLMSLLY